MRYLRFNSLLVYLVAGFVVENLTSCGPRLREGVSRTASIVFVVFFATAGAHLDLPLLFSVWPVALALATIRIVATWGAGRAASRVAGDPPLIRRWGSAVLISQAGLALGLTLAIEKTFPSFGASFRSLAVATVAINEVLGPILFKAVLDRTGESSAVAPEVAPSSPQAVDT